VFFGAMSKAQILEAIPKLTPEEREEIRQKLDEFDDELSAEDLALIDARIAEHEADPHSAIPLEEFKARLKSKYRL
jgi:putative addiction module component (TIGR02574 family)